MSGLFGRIRIPGLRRRYLFNIYLLLGSVSIVVITTVFTIRVSQSVERQAYLTTKLLSGVASRLFTAQDLSEVQPIIEIINENEVPFINGGEPVHVPEIPTLASLGVIVVTLAVTTAASLYKTRVRDAR